MKKDLLNIEFYFPDDSLEIKNKEELSELIMKAMKENGSVKYAGYANEKDLEKDLIKHMGKGDMSQYRKISKGKQKKVEKIICKTIKKCNEVLPLPTKNFIFVFPWFPTKEKSMFRGSFGFAAYSCVIHLFIDPQKITKKSIADSIAHEVNHTIFYYYHFEKYGRYSLLDNLVIEGMAENFREDILGGDPAPWAIALSKEDAFKKLISIQLFLPTEDTQIQRDIFFGNKEYKRWTGYSIGYWLVKEFRDLQPSVSWEKLIKISPKQILKIVKEKRV